MTIEEKAKEWFNNTVEKGLTAERGIVTTYCPDAIAGFIAGAKEEVNNITVEQALAVIMEHGNTFFEDYEGKISPITYYTIDKSGDIIFME